MDITLLAHTCLVAPCDYPERAALALTAIRTCYSPEAPSGIIENDGTKYFGAPATDNEGGTDADRLIRFITRSGHTSTLEHVSYTFALEGVSRSLLAQLTRHRVGFSFSVQSQRYVRFGSDDKAHGFDYVTPPTIDGSKDASEIFDLFMAAAQACYDGLRAAGVPPEDARFVLPNAAACNIVMTCNLRALLDFCSKREPGNGAQWEIAELATELRRIVTSADPWTEKLFS